ncbi:adenosine deaminase [Agromyces sp. Soil535]|uniref:adenosine deaminase n=1 Tax=Agromyces sp. Soil535 TaxID=1736390 RepID=UPI0006FE03BF|nr:adenosine deaminase [Agromyces sp. Soil535]KRE20962.1 adenosine deaminase [Agromyces sp. Soil535]
MTTWPTAELHVHVEGTLEADLLVELARRNDVRLPSYDPEVLTARYAFADLQSFLDVYYSNLSVLRTEQDFYDLASAYLRRAEQAGVRRAEIFFDPQTHLGNGVPFEAVIRGLDAAIADATRGSGLSADLILCFQRDLGADAAMQTLETALPFRDSFIGVGLDSAEVGYPPSLFTEVYARAAAEGLHRVAHAGEEGGPEYVREALDMLKVERVDHGNRALEDPALVQRLRDERIPLTVCPLSNVALRTAPSDLAQHPLTAMLAEGLLVSVNSDDPAYFGGYVDDNYRAMESALSLDASQLAMLARNSFESTFATDAAKAAWIAEVDAVLAKVSG